MRQKKRGRTGKKIEKPTVDGEKCEQIIMKKKTKMPMKTVERLEFKLTLEIELKSKFNLIVIIKKRSKKKLVTYVTTKNKRARFDARKNKVYELYI